MQFTSILYTLAMLFVCTLAAPLEVRQEKVSNVKCTSSTYVASRLSSPRVAPRVPRHRRESLACTFPLSHSYSLFTRVTMC